MPMVNSKIHVSLAEIADADSVAPLWLDLEARSEHSYFISWAWIGTWLRTMPKDIHPLLMKAFDGDRLVGLAVLGQRDVVRHGFVRSRTLYLHETGDQAIDELTMEFNGILSEKGREQDIAAACLQHLITEVNDWDEIVLSGLHESQTLRNLSSSGANFEVPKTQAVYFVDLKDLRDTQRDYPAAVPKRIQYTLRRALRESSAIGPVQATIAQDLQQAQQFFEALKELHQAHWTAIGMPGSFSNAYFNRFHDELLRTRFESGEIQLIRAAAGDRTVGYLYNFVHRGHVYHYQGGIDYASWPAPAAKPGFICHYLAIEHNRLAGADTYDLMAGDDRYKRELGTHSTQMYWAVLQRDRPKFRIERGLKRLVEGVRSRAVVGADSVQGGT